MCTIHERALFESEKSSACFIHAHSVCVCVLWVGVGIGSGSGVGIVIEKAIASVFWWKWLVWIELYPPISDRKKGNCAGDISIK